MPPVSIYKSFIPKTVEIETFFYICVLARAVYNDLPCFASSYLLSGRSMDVIQRGGPSHLRGKPDSGHISFIYVFIIV